MSAFSYHNHDVCDDNSCPLFIPSFVNNALIHPPFRRRARIPTLMERCFCMFLLTLSLTLTSAGAKMGSFGPSGFEFENVECS